MKFTSHLEKGAPFVAAGVLPMEFIRQFMYCGDPIPQDLFKGAMDLEADGKLASLLTSDAQLERNKKELYAALTNANKHYELFPGMAYVDTSSFREIRSVIDARPDAAVYSEDAIPGEKGDRSLRWASVEMVVECKFSKNDDGYTDDPAAPINDTEAGRRTASQTMVYMASHLRFAHRTHGFMLQITGCFARFIYYDRSAIVISQAFNYTKTPSILALFTRSFCTLSQEHRGWDNTVTKLSAIEETDFRQRFTNLPKAFEIGQLIRIALPMTPKESKTFIAPSLPANSVGYLAGRGTRCFQVIPEDSQDPEVKPMFLKDVWRYDIFPKEGHFYSKIKFLPNVMSMHLDADISMSGLGRHDTKLSVEFCRDRLENGDVYLHHHYRIVLDEVGRQLIEFKSSREAVTAIRDAIIGLDAVAKLGILQQDISVGNILICDKGGKLSDFDCAAEEEDCSPRRQFHVGTWQLMSVHLLQVPDARRTLEDDLESCLWVLFWLCLRYMKHTFSSKPKVFKHHLITIFDSTVEFRDDEALIGGDGKLKFFYRLGSLKNFEVKDCEPLGDLVWGLRKLFRSRYVGVAPETRDDETEVEQPHELITAQKVLKLFNKALDKEGWPLDDVAQEQLPTHMVEPVDNYQSGATTYGFRPRRCITDIQAVMPRRRGRVENNDELGEVMPKLKRLRRERTGELTGSK